MLFSGGVKMFCKKCNNLMMPGDDVMKCSCGYVQKDGKISEKKKKKDEVVVVEKKGNETLPKTDYECKECGNKKAYFWTMQTRSADEPETRFYKCTKCSNIAREY